MPVQGLISGIIRFTMRGQGFCKLQGGFFFLRVPGSFAPGGQAMKMLMEILCFILFVFKDFPNKTQPREKT